MRLIDVPMLENDIGAFTVGEFLERLLTALWEEADGFSGKRPFGNSDWQYQVYASLIKSGYNIGRLDEYGDVDDVNYQEADRLIKSAIKEQFEAEPVKHGRWVKYYNSFFGQHQCFCSECEGSEYWKKYYCYGVESYCPNCGAKMDGDVGD